MTNGKNTVWISLHDWPTWFIRLLGSVGSLVQLVSQANWLDWLVGWAS